MPDIIPTWEQTTPVDEHIPTWEQTTPVPNQLFSPSKKSWQRLKNAFSGDPLAFIDDPQIRADMSFHIERMGGDVEQERKKWALAAYFSQMRREEIQFCHGNIDSLIKKFNGGKEQSVDQAYAEIGRNLNFQRPEKTFWENRTAAALAAGAGRTAETAFNAARFLSGLWTELAVTSTKAELLARNPQAAEKIADPAQARKQVETAVMAPFEKYILPDIKWAEENMQLPENWVSSSKNISDWFSNAGIALVNYFPQLGAQTGLMISTGGTAALASVMGVNGYYNIKDDHPEMTEEQAMLYGIGIGIINGGLEKITQGIISGKVSKEVAREGIKKGLHGIIRHFGANASKEALEEGAEQFAENMLDIRSGLRGDERNWKASDWMRELFRNVPESAVISLPVGAGFAVDSYRSLRQAAARQDALRNVINNKVQELSQKENLTGEETKQLSVLKTLDDSANTVELEKAVEKIYIDEFLKQQNTENITEEEKELQAQSEAVKRMKMRRDLAFNPQDVIDKVQEYSTNFKDTVFHVVEDWSSIVGVPHLEVSARGAYDTKTGEVYINAQKVRPHEVLEVMLHEVVGHKGLRSVFKDESLDALLDQVYREHFNDDDFKEVAARYFDPVEVTDEEDGSVYLDIDLQKVEDQRIAAEEYIAHLAEKEVKPSWWKELLQRIRMAFSRLPHFKEVRMTDDQINILLARASRKMRRGMFDRKSVVLADGNGQKTTDTDGTGGDGKWRMAAALRKPGDPNNAEQKEKLTDGNVPHVSGFMEWAGLKAKNLYADYEFLYSRHHKYFSSPEEAKAAVELVLAKPEQVKNVRKNLSFVGFDEVTGDIYRIEINPVITGKANHIRSVFKITADNYNEIKLEPPRVLQPSKTALQDGRAATMTITNFMDNIPQNPENASGDLSDGSDKSDGSDELRFSIADYSLDEQSDIIDILTPYIGTIVDKTPAEIAAFLKERGVDIPETDAYAFAKEAARQKMQSVRKAADARASNWLYENVIEYKWAVDFAGGNNFRIQISPRFENIEKAGTFWLKKKDKNSGNVISLEELAKYVSREYGLDELDIEQKIFDFYKDLTKPQLRKMYTEFRNEQLAGNRAAARAAFDEFMQQEKFRIEDEAIQILTAGQPVVTIEWINDNRKVYQELYKRLFNGKEAPGKPAKRDIEAINAALLQEGANADTYAQAYKAARMKAFEEYQERLRSIREKVLQSKADAVSLQRDAAAFAAKHLPKEARAEFISNIISLLNYSAAPSTRYPEGHRRAEYDKLIAKMTRRASEARKADYLDKIAKRLQQLGERVDSSRKVRGIRDIQTQEILNRIIQISRMNNAEITAAINQNLQQLESRIEAGEKTADLEYDIALLNQYGELWEKSADDVKTALVELNLIAKTGRDRLKKEIDQRSAADELDRNEFWKSVNDLKRYSSNELQKRNNLMKNRSGFKKLWDQSFWASLSLDGMLDAFTNFNNQDNIVTRFKEMAHQAVLNKNTVNMKNAQECRNFIKNLLHTDSGFEVAKHINMWRNVEKNTGVFRFVPDPNEKQFKFEKIDVTKARKLLAQYDRGQAVVTDYEAEAIRQQLATIDRKVKFDVPTEFRDGVTETLLEIIEKENPQEPVVVIPRSTFNGNSEQMELSQMQALYIKLMWDQKDIRYKMHFNGYSDDTMKQIDNFLLPEVKKLGEWMRKQLELDRNGIENVYKEIYFTNFPKNENYFPSIFESQRNNNVKSSAVDLTEETSANAAIQYSPGALKVRVYHLNDLFVADALTVFQNHRLMMNHFVTHAPVSRKMRSVLLNPNVRKAVEYEYGKEAYQELKLALRDFINGGNADVAVNDFMAKLYSNAVRSKMAFNQTGGFKQTLGLITYLQEIPAKDLLSGIKYAMTHPQEVFDTLAHTDYFKQRWSGGANAEIKMLLDTAGKDSSRLAYIMNNINEFGSMSLRIGDAVSTLVGGFAVYKYYYEQLAKRGIDPEEAKKQAIIKWEMATERTQQSSSPFLLNRYQRGGYATRIFTTFLSNQILLWNHNAPAVFKALKHKNKIHLKDFKSGMAALILSSIAMTAFDQIKEHWNDGEFELWDFIFNALQDSITGFGPIGSVASSAVQALKPGGFNSNAVYSDLFYGGKALIRQITNDAADISDDVFKDAVRILQAAGYFYEPAAQVGAVARELRKWVKIITE